MKTQVIKLFINFIQSRPYLSKDQKDKFETELKFNSDSSQLRKAIQDIEEEIDQCEKQESCCDSLSDIKDTLASIVTTIKKLEQKENNPINKAGE